MLGGRRNRPVLPNLRTMRHLEEVALRNLTESLCGDSPAFVLELLVAREEGDGDGDGSYSPSQMICAATSPVFTNTLNPLWVPPENLGSRFRNVQEFQLCVREPDSARPLFLLPVFLPGLDVVATELSSVEAVSAESGGGGGTVLLLKLRGFWLAFPGSCCVSPQRNGEENDLSLAASLSAAPPSAPSPVPKGAKTVALAFLLESAIRHKNSLDLIQSEKAETAQFRKQIEETLRQGFSKLRGDFQEEEGDKGVQKGDGGMLDDVVSLGLHPEKSGESAKRSTLTVPGLDRHESTQMAHRRSTKGIARAQMAVQKMRLSFMSDASFATAAEQGGDFAEEFECDWVPEGAAGRDRWSFVTARTALGDAHANALTEIDAVGGVGGSFVGGEGGGELFFDLEDDPTGGGVNRRSTLLSNRKRLSFCKLSSSSQPRSSDSPFHFSSTSFNRQRLESLEEESPGHVENPSRNKPMNRVERMEAARERLERVRLAAASRLRKLRGDAAAARARRDALMGVVDARRRRVEHFKKATMTLQQRLTQSSSGLCSLTGDLQSLKQALFCRRTRVLLELCNVFPIENHGGRFRSVRGLEMPSLDVLKTMDVREEETVTAAMGFVTHLLVMIAKYLQVHLRVQPVFNSSNSFLRDAGGLCLGSSSPTAAGGSLAVASGASPAPPLGGAKGPAVPVAAPSQSGAVGGVAASQLQSSRRVGPVTIPPPLQLPASSAGGMVVGAMPVGAGGGGLGGVGGGGLYGTGASLRQRKGVSIPQACACVPYFVGPRVPPMASSQAAEFSLYLRGLDKQKFVQALRVFIDTVGQLHATRGLKSLQRCTNVLESLEAFLNRELWAVDPLSDICL